MTDEVNKYLLDRIKELEKELEAVTTSPEEREIDVREHYKYLRNGKNYLWSSHKRLFHNGLTESPTKEHKLFVNLYISQVDHSVVDKYLTEFSIGDERRCDILLYLKNGRKFCIECQLSKISRKDLYNRTFYYLHNGYEVQWILNSSYANNQYLFNRLISYCNHLGYKACMSISMNDDLYIFDIRHSSNEKTNLHKLIVKR